MNSVKEFSPRTLPLLICALICSSIPVSAQQQQKQQPQRPDRVVAPTPSPQASPIPAAPTSAASPTPPPQSSPTPHTVMQGAPSTAAVKPATTIGTEFAELLAAESYMIVGEMSSINEVVNSNLMVDALAPFERLGEVPKEIVALRGFMTRQAEALETTRISFAAQPMRPGLPQIIIRIQCADAEVARKLESPLKNLLRTLFVAAPETKSKATNVKDEPIVVKRVASTTTDKPPTTTQDVKGSVSAAPPASANKDAVSPYIIKVVERSIFVSDADFKLTDLRSPTAQTSLAESTRYTRVRTRFAAEPLFIFYDLKLLERSLEDAMQKQRAMMEQAEKEQAEREQADKARAANGDATADVAARELEAAREIEAAANANPDEVAENSDAVLTVSAPPEAGALLDEVVSNDEGTSSVTSRASTDLLNILMPSLFSSSFTSMLGGAEAVGVGLSLTPEAIRLRTLMTTPDKDYVSPVPFLPQIISGAPNGSRAASLLPADAEVFVSTSLDMQKSFNKFLEGAEKRVEGIRPPQRRVTNGVVEAANTETESPPVNSAALYVVAIEAQLNFKIKEDLLATLGSEVAFAMLPPVPAASPDEKKSANVNQAPSDITSGEKGSKADNAAVKPKSGEYGFVGLISVTDKTRLQTLLPKAVELLGIKLPGVTPATLFERRGDIEYLRFAPGVAAAFIGDFLVIASDDSSLQRVVATT